MSEMLLACFEEKILSRNKGKWNVIYGDIKRSLGYHDKHVFIKASAMMYKSRRADKLSAERKAVTGIGNNVMLDFKLNF